MPTLSELFLQLSRDISDNDRQLRDAVEQLEQDRGAALAALPQAADALKAWRKAVLEAETDRDDAFAKVEREHRRADQDATKDREAALRAVEAGLKADDASALRKRNDAEARALAEYEADIAKIGAINETGIENFLTKPFDNDELLVLFSRDVLTRNPGAVIVSEVKCSQRLYDDIARHGILSTPGLIVDGKIKHTGKPLPSLDKVKELIKGA